MFLAAVLLFSGGALGASPVGLNSLGKEGEKEVCVTATCVFQRNFEVGLLSVKTGWKLFLSAIILQLKTQSNN